MNPTKQITINTFCLVFSILFSTTLLKAQIGVNTAVTANDLITAISGPGVIITNPVLNCPNLAYGTFTGGAGNLGINDGKGNSLTNATGVVEKKIIERQ